MENKQGITDLKIRKLAEEKGFSVDTLARRSGVNFNTLSNIWTGKVGNPTLETSALIARALNVPIEDLFVLGEPDQQATPALAIM